MGKILFSLFLLMGILVGCEKSLEQQLAETNTAASVLKWNNITYVDLGEELTQDKIGKQIGEVKQGIAGRINCSHCMAPSMNPNTDKLYEINGVNQTQAIAFE